MFLFVRCQAAEFLRRVKKIDSNRPGAVRELSGYSENSLIFGHSHGLVLFHCVEVARGTTIRPPGCGALGVPSSQTRFVETGLGAESRSGPEDHHVHRNRCECAESGDIVHDLQGNGSESRHGGWQCRQGATSREGDRPGGRPPPDMRVLTDGSTCHGLTSFSDSEMMPSCVSPLGPVSLQARIPG